MNWLPSESAPRTGEHILVTNLGSHHFGKCGGKWQDWCDVVHFWDNPGEEGFYPSNGPDEPATFTHWMPLELVGSLPAQPTAPSDAQVELVAQRLFMGSVSSSLTAMRREARELLDAVAALRSPRPPQPPTFVPLTGEDIVFAWGVKIGDLANAADIIAGMVNERLRERAARPPQSPA